MEIHSIKIEGKPQNQLGRWCQAGFKKSQTFIVGKNEANSRNKCKRIIEQAKTQTKTCCADRSYPSGRDVSKDLFLLRAEDRGVGRANRI